MKWAALPVNAGTREVISGGAYIILDKEGILKLLLNNIKKQGEAAIL